MRADRRFLFGLARELGMTVGQLLRSITARELAEWAAYFKLESERLEAKGQDKAPSGGKKPGDVDANLKTALQKLGKQNGGKRR